VLIVANDVVGRQMAGPGIRCFEFARQLAGGGHQVTLAAPGRGDLEGEPFAIVEATGARIQQLGSTHDVAVVQGFALEQFPTLRHPGLRLVVDLYDPFPLALLEQFAAEPMPRRQGEHTSTLAAAHTQLRAGDFFLCASEQQRDFWLGALTAMGRVNPATHTDDRRLRRLIDVVPFGLPEAAPVATGPGPRGTIPGIAPGDLLLLWGGGIYNWFDPLTLIRAVARLTPTLPRLRLLFLSTTHPNPNVPAMWMLGAARRLAEELGLTGRHVFFNDSWVPYSERANWLLEADIGVSTHFDHIETRFAFRTRILDYLWAGLPILCTAGDTLAEMVSRSGLGLTVPPEDVDAASSALARLGGDPALRRACADQVRAEAQRLTWDRCTAPLVRFCAEPRAAADRADAPVSLALVVAEGGVVTTRRSGPGALALAGARLAARLRAGRLGRLGLEARRLTRRAVVILRTEGLGGIRRGARRWRAKRRHHPPPAA